MKALDGALPAATGPCASFIDPFGRPLSPVSAAGMHRRARRRRRLEPRAAPGRRAAFRLSYL